MNVRVHFLIIFFKQSVPLNGPVFFFVHDQVNAYPDLKFVACEIETFELMTLLQTDISESGPRGKLRLPN